MTPIDLSAGLGTLSKLPPEIRGEIWSHLFPERTDFRGHAVPTNYFLISRCFTQEFGDSFYRGRSLFLSIDPAERAGKFGTFSSFFAKDQSGFIALDLSPAFLRFLDLGWEDETDPERLVMNKKFPYHQLKSLHLDVVAPRVNEPGEVVQAWNRLWFLVRLLNISGTPKLQIRFLESTDRSWSAHGKLNRSVPDYNDSTFASDLEMLLIPLMRLRNASSIEVETQGVELDGPCKLRLARLLSNATSTVPFGSGYDPHDNLLDDKALDAVECGVALWLDYQLGDLPGAAAARLRAEQYATHDYDHRQASLDQLKGSDLHGASYNLVFDALIDRSAAVYTFNPMGLERDDTDSVCGCDGNDYLCFRPEKHYPHGDSIEYPIVGMDRVGVCCWDREQSIPRSSSAEFTAMLKRSEAVPVSRKWSWRI